MESHGTTSALARLAASDVAAVDRLLADADAPARVVLPRRPGDPPAGAHRLRQSRPGAPGPDHAVGRPARAALEEHAPSPAAMAAATGMDRRRWTSGLAAGAGQARRRTDRGPPHRLRGRLRQPPRRRGGRATRSRVAARCRRCWPTRPVRRSGGIRFKSLEAATRRRGLRTLDLVARRGAGRRPAAGRLGRHPAEGHVGRPGRRRWPRSASELERAHGLPAGALRFEIQVETPQADPRRRRDGDGGRHDRCRRPRTVQRLCTYGTYDYSAASASPPASRAWPTRPPTTPRRSCRWPRPAPACGCRTARPTCCRSATDERPGGVGAARPAGHAGPCARGVLPGLGPASRPPPEPVPGDLRVLPATVCAAAAAGCAAYLNGVEGGVLDEPATAQALAASCSAACTAARSTTPRCSSRPASASRGRRSTRWRVA